MTSIDINKLTVEELEDLNHRIVKRLKYLDMVDAQQVMMALSIGTQVSFETQRHGRVFGTVIKLNRKTVSVLTDEGRQWNVSPHLLTPIKDATPKQRFVYANELTKE